MAIITNLEKYFCMFYMAVATSEHCLRHSIFAQIQCIWELFALIAADSYDLDVYQ